MAGAALMNGFANMGNAFMRSYQAESDRLRQQARQDAEAQWQNELRGRQRKTWGREDAEEAAIAAAFKPVQGETPQDGVAAGMASRGIGVVQEEGDSTYRQQLRAADALMPINPKRAIEMRNAAIGSRSTELGLKKAERDEINEHYNNMLVGALDSAPTWYEGAANFAKEAMGANVVYELSEDGKKVSLYGIEADGKRKLTGTYKADGSGALEFLDKASKQDAKTKMAMLRANMEYERARADKAEDREADLAGRERLARTEAGLREGAAARASARSQASDAERAAAGVALYQERNPNATSAEIEAVRRGILPAVPPERKGGYKVEAGDVTSLLGTPATDANGNALVDPMTGRQVVNRDPAREREFFQFMRESGITDTNEALAKFLAPERGRADAATGRSIARGQVVNGYEFLGGDPKSQKSWRQVSSGRVN